MWHPTPADLDRGRLARTVGRPALDRGAGYTAGGRVLDLAWDPGLLRLTGIVAGNGSVYSTTALFDVAADGALLLEEGHCTCPMRRNCKHVAAIALQGADRWRSGAGAADVPSWELLLAPAVHAGSPVDGVRPLAIGLALRRDPGSAWDGGRVDAHRLLARVVTPARRGGWTGEGLAWDRLDSWSGRTAAHPEDQVRALAQLAAVHRAGGGHFGYASTAVIELGEAGAGLWPMLDLAAAAGVRTVHLAADHGDVVRVADRTVALDLTGAPDGGLVLAGALTPVGDPDGPAAGDGVVVAWLGDPAHGVVLADADQVADGGDPAGWAVRLARLDPPVPAGIRRLVDGDPLPIAADQVERFTTRMWPRLRRVVAIGSSDGAFAPPTITGPRARLTVHHAADHRARISWSIGYDVGGTAVEVPWPVPDGAGPRRPAGVGDRGVEDREDGADHGDRAGRPDPAVAAIRDRDAERRVVADVTRAVTALATPPPASGTRDALPPGAGDLPALLDRHGALRPVATTSGMTTAEVSTDLVPTLAARPDVDVVVLGQPADYRDVGDGVVIGVGTAAVGDQRDWFNLSLTVSAGGAEIPFSELFRALSAGQTRLLLPDGRHLGLDRPDLQALRDLILEARALTDPDGAPSLRISPYQADLWAELSALGVITQQAEAWQQRVTGLLAADPAADVDVPDGIHAVLRPYQVDGFRWLALLWQHRLGGILADDMGLGKTLQALALVVHARQCEPAAPPFLVVAPTSVVHGWAVEASRFAPGLRVAVLDRTRAKAGVSLTDAVAGADVVVTSYTLLRLDADHHAARRWGGLVLDEAQAVKNHRSKLYGAVRRLDADVRIAVTGTPVENHLMELWSLLSITAPGLFPDPRAFDHAYARPIQRDGDDGQLARLRRRIRPLVTRRTKQQVAADLPPKQEQVLEVELHPAHRRTYQLRLQRERQRILGLLDDLERNRLSVLQSLTVLRQLSLHAGLIDPDAAGTSSAKLDVLVDHLREVADGGHRALVFSQFTRFLGLARDRLEGAGIATCYLDGRTRDRAAAVQAFRTGDAPAFLISLKAGGFGLNLTEADYCFLLDPWWNPAAEAQAIDRTHRIGQTRNVMVYRLIARDTIEEKVLALAQRKAAMVRGVMADGDPFAGGLTRDDIAGLFG